MVRTDSSGGELVRPSLSVSLLPGLVVRSPFGVASSHFTGDERAIKRMLGAKPGFLTLKSTSERHGGNGAGNRRYQRLDDAGLPFDFLADGPRTLELLLTARSAELAKFAIEHADGALIGASILAGEDHVSIAPALEAAGVHFCEINFKYFGRNDDPNGPPTKISPADYANALRAECAAFRQASSLPCFMKLTRGAATGAPPEVLAELARTFAPLGFIVANAPRRASVAMENGAPHLFWGAHSGASLLPQTLALLAEIAGADTPTIASGGIMSAEAAFGCLALGARGLQLCSAVNFHADKTFKIFEEQLTDLLARAGKPSVEALIGAHRGALDTRPDGIPLSN